MNDGGALAALVVVGVVVMYLFWRYFITHARRETFRSVLARRSGAHYDVKPMKNSGWYVVGLVVIAVIIVLVVVS